MDDLDELASAVRQQTMISPLRPATALSRLAAAAADLIAIVFLNLAVIGVTTMFLSFTGWRERSEVYVLIIWVTTTLYTAAEILIDNSFGKGIAAIIIARPDGTPASRARLLRRWLIKYSFLLLLGLNITVAMLIDRKAIKNPKPFDVLLEDISQILAWCWPSAFLIIAAGSLGMFFPGAHTLHDLLAGTKVFNHLDLARKGPPKPRPFAVQTIEPQTVQAIAPTETQIADDKANPEPQATLSDPERQ
jgi:hypothetical protein